MTRNQRDVLLALIALLPVFWWLIDGAANIGTLIKVGMVAAMVAGVLLAIPARGDNGEDD